MQDLQKLKQIIKESQNISILPSPDFRKDSFPASLGLFYSLKKLGKNVNLLAEDYPRKYDFLVKKEKFCPSKADFLISIKEARTKLAHLFYEKTTTGLNLFLKTNGGELKQEDISLEPLDSGGPLITVGVADFKTTEKFLKEEPSSLINIDNQLENENYGRINLVTADSPTLSEIAFDFLESIDRQLFDANASNALLYGIVHGTSSFQNLKTNSQTFQKVSFLIERGANLKEITSHLYGQVGTNSLRVFGRVLSKLNVSEKHDIAWALLKKEDFDQTESSSADLRFTLEKLSSGIFPFQNFLVVWEAASSPLFVQGVFYSPNSKMIEKVLVKLKGSQKGNGVLFRTKETDLEKIKDKIIDSI